MLNRKNERGDRNEPGDQFDVDVLRLASLARQDQVKDDKSRPLSDDERWKEISDLLDKEPRLWSYPLQGENDRKYTLFHLLCEYGNWNLEVLYKFLCKAKDAGKLAIIQELTKPILWKPRCLNELLCAAAKRGDVESMIEFFSLGAELESGGNTGKRAIHRAAEGMGYGDLYLMAPQQIVEISQKKLVINGNAVLLVKAEESFIVYFVSRNKLMDVTKSTSIALPGYLLDSLNRQPVGINGKISEFDGFSKIIQLATSNCCATAVQWLLERGIDAQSLPRVDGTKKTPMELWTPLQLAAQQGYLESVQRLIRRGVSLEHQNHNGSNALMLAAARGHVEVVDCLLMAGAEPNTHDLDGNTPLHHVIRKKSTGAQETEIRERIVELLLRAGSDNIVRNNHKQLPGDLAQDNKYSEDVVKLINKWNRALRQGWRLEVKNKNKTIQEQGQLVKKLRIDLEQLSDQYTQLLTIIRATKPDFIMPPAPPKVSEPAQPNEPTKSEQVAVCLGVWSWVAEIIRRAEKITQQKMYDETQPTMSVLALSDKSLNVVQNTLCSCLQQVWEPIEKYLQQGNSQENCLAHLTEALAAKLEMKKKGHLALWKPASIYITLDHESKSNPQQLRMIIEQALKNVPGLVLTEEVVTSSLSPKK